MKMGKLLNFISSVSAIGALLAYAIKTFDVPILHAEASTFLPLLIGVAIVSGIAGFFVKAVWRMATIAAFLIGLLLAYLYAQNIL